MEKVNKFNQKIRTSKKTPELRTGNIVRIHRKIKEGNKERVQVFEGIVVSVKAKQSSSPMLTVRKVSHGVGIEIIVPLFSPAVEKIEVVKKAKTRQAKLYYLRGKNFKLSKLKMKELAQFAAQEDAEEPPEETVSVKAEAAEKQPESDSKEDIAEKNPETEKPEK